MRLAIPATHEKQTVTKIREKRKINRTRKRKRKNKIKRQIKIRNKRTKKNTCDTNNLNIPHAYIIFFAF